MKKLYSFSLVVALLAAALLPIGCATTNQAPRVQDAVIKTAVQYAVLEYIGDDLEKAERVGAVANAALAALSDKSEPVVLDLLVNAAQKEIDWSKLAGGERVLVMNLISIIRIELQAMIDAKRADGGLTPSELNSIHSMDVQRVLDWVHDAALLHFMGARAK